MLEIYYGCVSAFSFMLCMESKNASASWVATVAFLPFSMRE